jgi:molecular chaperone DnaK
VADVRSTLESDDAARIKSATETLFQEIQKIGGAVYEQPGQSAPSGAGPSGEGPSGEGPSGEGPKPGSPDDNVVDGEFRNA